MNAVQGKFKDRTLCKIRKESGTRCPKPVRPTRVLHPPDAEVRKRITSQKKEILEDSEEWSVLYRKYYADELRRMGIAAAPDDRRERRS
jgi:hypothetical protein